MTPSPCGPSRTDPQSNRSVQQYSVDQRNTAVLGDASQQRPFSNLRASCRVCAAMLSERLGAMIADGYRLVARRTVSAKRRIPADAAPRQIPISRPPK
jgi:hypothetical protein